MPKTPAQLRASKKYYEKNREKYLLYGTEYRNTNREILYEKKMNKQSSMSIAADGEQIIPTTYYELHREHLLEKQRGYDAVKQSRVVALKSTRQLFKELPIYLILNNI